MVTIVDYKKAGEKLKKNWTSEYLLTGCPFRACSRAILWAVGIRSEGLSDALSMPGIVVLGIGPVALLIWTWWWWLLLAYPLIVGLGYGPFHRIGIDMHGDPFAPGGKLAEKPKTDEELAAEAKAKEIAKKAKDAKKKLAAEIKAARKAAKKAKKKEADNA